MNCLEARSRLDEHLDCELSPDLVHRLTEHLAECPACARHAEALGSIAEQARALPSSVEPPRDLWLDIDRRIDELESGTATTSARRHHRDGRAWQQAAIAAALFALLVVGAWWLRQGELTEPTGTPPAAIAAVPVVSTDIAQVVATPLVSGEIGQAEAALLMAKMNLRAVLEERRDTLSPKTAAMVDRNLEIIEQAVDEISSALDRDPGNRDLNRLLMAARQREIDLLQRVTRASQL